MESVIENTYARLERCGAKGRVVPIHRLQVLKREIEGEHVQGVLDKEFFQERLSSFAFTPPAEFSPAVSLIIVAVPRPQTKVGVSWKGNTRVLILPPTYVKYAKIPQQVGGLINSVLTPEGYHIALARVPLKFLAACSGLAEYGRNNLCYVPGMGSFLQLVGFYSDVPCEEDHWHEPRMMDRCQKCESCLRKCPTRAIGQDRFLLRAERCISFHNERLPSCPLPVWMDLASHNCLIGCMHCQQYCPANKEFLEWFEDNQQFSDEETSLLLNGMSFDQFSLVTVRKLEGLALIESDLAVIPRNLGMLLQERDQPGNRRRATWE